MGYNSTMQVWENRSLFLGVFFSFVLSSFINNLTFAEDELTISISNNLVEMSLSQGEFSEESQIITAKTTDPAGYSIKIRTSGDSSALTNVLDDNYTIPTFSLPSGASSIPVSEIGNGYGYSIDGGNNYLPVPEPNTPATTLFKTTAAGQNTHELTFGVNVPTDTVAGTYMNTFIIEIVANLDPCDVESICYYGNGDDGTGSMPDQSAPSNTDVTLTPSNFSRSEYGFAGWNTEADGSGTSYGPSQTINVGDLDTEGLQLYAMWVPSAGSMQTWRGCDAMNSGDITALTDTRDNSTYAIAKYSDGECWMMENLRLDLSDTNVSINNYNTNRPTSGFMDKANLHPASSNSFCLNDNADCIDRLLFNNNNLNRNLNPDPDANDAGSSWYSYGIYYNYYTATAGNGGFNLKTRGAVVNGDICPTGWKLPTGSKHDDNLAKLDMAYDGTGYDQETNPNGIIASNRWRTYPLNFIYSGEQNGSNGYNRGISAGMTTANNGGASTGVNLWLRATAVSLISNSTRKTRGQPVRCIAKKVYDVIGNIHYDGNGGTGAMSDDLGVNFSTAHAANNQFTRMHFEFLGWNTAANGSGMTITEGGAVDDAAIQLSLIEGETLMLYAMWRPIYRVEYNGNGADAGSMANMAHEDVTSDFYLIASDYSKSGFGFMGWSTDANAGAKLLNHEAVTVYGPNQRVVFDNAFKSNADTNNQITLYAVWVAADGNDTLQTFNASRCAAMNTGDVLALSDERDGDTYAVTKLADGNCWMAENLRLDPSANTFTASNTNNPTSTFNNEASLSYDSTVLCNDDTSTCIDQVLFNANNINRGLVSSPATDNDASSWYSYGIMYGWYAATAGNGNYAMSSGSVTGDICPAGWRLPTGGASGEFKSLTNLLAGGSVVATNDNMLAFPNNFIYSGDYNHDKSGGRGAYGRYWSATANGRIKAYRLGVAANTTIGVTPEGSWNKWDAFAVRCILKQQQ